VSTGTKGPTRHDSPDSRAGTGACAVCGSKLSVYNANPTCWAHTLEIPWKGPNHKPR
jgi:hypothetical protein